MKKLAIIGAGGHGKVIADIAVQNGYEKIVFFDDNIEARECAGFPVVGNLCEAESLECDKIIAIGNAAIREKFQSKVGTVKLIHPKAIISRRVEIGEGTVVMAGAVINSDTVIGKGCIINTDASVDHDCKIGDFVHVSVGAHVAGTVSVGKGSWIGAGAVISNNIHICSDCMIGAGAVVVRDVEEAGFYVGVPVKKIK